MRLRSTDRFASTTSSAPPIPETSRCGKPKLDGPSSKPGPRHNHKQLLAGDQRERAPVERATFRHGPNVTRLFQRSVLTLRGAWHGRNRRSSMSRPAAQSDVSPGGRSGRLYLTPHRADRLVTLRNQRRSAASTKDPPLCNGTASSV